LIHKFSNGDETPPLKNLWINGETVFLGDGIPSAESRGKTLLQKVCGTESKHVKVEYNFHVFK